MATKLCTSDAIAAFLRHGPTNAASVIRHFGTSQSTFSRLCALIPRCIAIGSSRARQYAIRRQVFGVEDDIPVYRVSIDGKIELIGDMVPLEGNSYAFLSKNGTSDEIYRGHPFFLSDLRPQGFLGRMVPRNNAELNFPENILEWTDDDVLRYLVTRGEALAGDILIGGQSYLRFIHGGNKSSEFVDDLDRETAYPLLAELTMKGGAPGSSAGGEQPKFVAVVRSGNAFRHVIVKFSPPLASPNGRRWADLLLCEKIALDVLNDNHIEAAHACIIDAGGRRFLEVDRFDRNGLHGRLPMVTMAGLDACLGMLDQKWCKVASTLHSHGQISLQDKNRIELLDSFGYLIGNTDRHHGNMAFSWDQQQKFRLLPIYDMLPMYYRPNQHGEIVSNVWAPSHIDPGLVRHLPAALTVASQFFERVGDSPLISASFKSIAMNHAQALKFLR